MTRAPTVTPLVQVSAPQAIAYRVAAHGLAERLPASSLNEVVGGALRHRPPDGAGASLHARVQGHRPEHFEQALADGRLAAIYAMRGAVYVVAGADTPVFTAGSLPADNASLRESLLSWGPYLDSVGIPVDTALNVVTDGVAAVLREIGGPATKGAISTGLHDRLPPELEPWCPGRCHAHHAPEALFRLALINAGTRVVPNAPGSTTFVAAEPPPADANHRLRARIELTRRFVHQYAPTSPSHFAAWAAIGLADARTRFASLDDELVPIDFEGHKTWALAVDADMVKDPPRATGVRLLPRDDPFTAQRDRDTLAPTKDLQRQIWTALGSTAILLHNGKLAGTWRGRKDGRRFVVSLKPLGQLPRRARAAIEQEAASYAETRGLQDAVVELPGPDE